MALHTELPIYRTRIAKLMLQRGHVVHGDITKIYRKQA